MSVAFCLIFCYVNLTPKTPFGQDTEGVHRFALNSFSERKLPDVIAKKSLRYSATYGDLPIPKQARTASDRSYLTPVDKRVETLGMDTTL